jgi:hypothetical protein
MNDKAENADIKQLMLAAIDERSKPSSANCFKYGLSIPPVSRIAPPRARQG